MRRSLISLVGVLVVAAVATAQPAKVEMVKKVSAAFEPAEARPGQTVTLKVTVQLADGYYTYPVVQPDPQARFSVNRITYPTAGPVVFVGETVDPVGPRTKQLDDIELLTYPGGGTWVRRAVVVPSASAGATMTKVQVKLLVCEEDRCFPPKTFDLEATLKVLDGPAVAVDPKYRDEVEKASKK